MKFGYTTQNKKKYIVLFRTYLGGLCLYANNVMSI